MELQSRFRGALLGLACGDAVGTTVEFKPRGSFPPATDMLGGGPFRLKPGQWTDDTSMALCLATSLIESNGFDPHDQMRRYCRWMDEGYLSSNGVCFDIGGTVRRALSNFKATGSANSGPTDPRSAGNGCLMRLAPAPMFFYGSRDDAVDHAERSARTTHGALECLEASRLFGAMIHDALSGKTKSEILFGQSVAETFSPSVASIAHGEYRDRTESLVKSTGYVIDSLEAALWCFHHTDSFPTAVLRAVNLGGDADTIAAIVGQLAGAYYGEQGIPAAWRRLVCMSDEITQLSDQLYGSAIAKRSRGTLGPAPAHQTEAPERSKKMARKTGEKVQLQYINKHGEFSSLTLDKYLADYLFRKTKDAMQWVQDRHDEFVRAMEQSMKKLEGRKLARAVGDSIRFSALTLALGDDEFWGDI